MEKDLTEEREKRCKPVVEKILELVLDEDLLLSDMAYVEQRVLEGMQTILRGIVVEHYNEISETVMKSLNFSFKEAEKKLWDGKDNDEVSVKDVDEVLKKD